MGVPFGPWLDSLETEIAWPGGRIDVNPCRNGTKRKTPGGRNLGVERYPDGRPLSREVEKLPDKGSNLGPSG